MSTPTSASNHIPRIDCGVLGAMADVVEHLHLLRTQLGVQFNVVQDPMLIHALGDDTVSLLDSPAQQHLARRPLRGFGDLHNTRLVEQIVVGPTHRRVRCCVDVVRLAEFHHFPAKSVSSDFIRTLYHLCKLQPVLLNLTNEAGNTPVLEVRVNLDLVDVRDGCRVRHDLLEVANLVVGDANRLEDAAFVEILHHLPALQSTKITIPYSTHKHMLD